jgi:hypothetical protein
MGASLRVGPPGGDVLQMLFSPDGRHAVTVNGNGTVYVLRLPPPPDPAGAAAEPAKP